MLPEWDVGFDLITPEGTLPINQTDPTTGWRFQLNPEKCSTQLPVRSTDDDVPQGDGAIPHRRWRSGYGGHLAIEPVIGPIGTDPVEVAAYGEVKSPSGEDLVAMTDLIGLHVNSMVRTGLVSGFPNARLRWTPSGQPTDHTGDRMFDRCQLNGTPVLGQDGTLGCSYDFDFTSPYPYYLSYTETDTVVYDAGTAGAVNIRNEGNIDGFAVVELFGPASDIILENLSIVDLNNVPLQIRYLSSLPGASAIGGSDYVEIEEFTGRVNLNGSGANRTAGVDFRYSTYWPLIPGDNFIACIGANALIKSNSYWG